MRWRRACWRQARPDGIRVPNLIAGAQRRQLPDAVAYTWMVMQATLRYPSV
ncbi:hypothetical protein FraEuI1c_1429 [Pseudofrankia inefficax]|uniref:Uncharacterized protein n=1 Tax=Pseudofrankia inefficax (strain DSM 45817 / CECT 9037 / DDB 130130 / EuI1c) TaxID=298654 RepID=E3J544_PSEI1|nr:hypothetical protein FraEuI1c_1429 [Pseudofrankia inefficax]